MSKRLPAQAADRERIGVQRLIDEPAPNASRRCA